MITYTAKILTDFPEAITTSCATPAANHLFTICDEASAKFLPEAQAQTFHHTVAQLTFPMQTNLTGYSNSRLLPHNMPETPRQGQLG